MTNACAVSTKSTAAAAAAHQVRRVGAAATTTTMRASPATKIASKSARKRTRSTSATLIACTTIGYPRASRRTSQSVMGLSRCFQPLSFSLLVPCCSCVAASPLISVSVGDDTDRLHFPLASHMLSQARCKRVQPVCRARLEAAEICMAFYQGANSGSLNGRFLHAFTSSSIRGRRTTGSVVEAA